MQISKNIKYSADVLKQEISKLKNDLGESAKADIQAAETEKQTPINGKNYHSIFEKSRKDFSSKNIRWYRKVGGQTSRTRKTAKRSREKIRTFSDNLYGALCAYGNLIMGSLIEVNGYDISFLKVAQGLGDWNAYLGSSDVSGMVNFLDSFVFYNGLVQECIFLRSIAFT